MKSNKKEKITAIFLATTIFIVGLIYGRNGKQYQRTDVQSIIDLINDNDEELLKSSTLFKNLTFDKIDMIESTDTIDDKFINQYIQDNQEIDFNEGIDYIKEFLKHLNLEATSLDTATSLKHEKESYSIYDTYDYYEQGAHYILNTIRFDSGNEYYDHITEIKKKSNLTQKVSFLFKYLYYSNDPVQLRRIYDISFHENDVYIAIYNENMLNSFKGEVKIQSATYRWSLFKAGTLICDEDISYKQFCDYIDELNFCLQNEPSFDDFSQLDLGLAKTVNRMLKNARSRTNNY